MRSRESGVSDFRRRKASQQTQELYLLVAHVLLLVPPHPGGAIRLRSRLDSHFVRSSSAPDTSGILIPPYYKYAGSWHGGHLEFATPIWPLGRVMPAAHTADEIPLKTTSAHTADE
jgi:hypothetical protein